jgi:nucleotide-binding universal stress UspA family protein
VMTSRGQGGMQRWMLGSVSEKLLREAKAPVLLIPVGRTGNEGRSAAQ